MLDNNQSTEPVMPAESNSAASNLGDKGMPRRPRRTSVETAHFYEEAEAVIAQLPRLGASMIMQTDANGNGSLISPIRMQKTVQRLRRELGLPSTFTLDSCRHGGVTKLEEASLTDGEGRALSEHRTQQSYIGYAKRTLARALLGTRKRHEHRRKAADFAE